MKIQFQVGKMPKHTVETKTNDDGSFNVFHNGENVAWCGSGLSQVDKIKKYTDRIIYGDLLKQVGF